MLCEKCGHEIQDDSQFCITCGTEVTTGDTQSLPSSEMRFCIQCGEKLLEDSLFCPACGVEAHKENESDSSASPEEGEQFCIKCGQKLLTDSQFCFSCGAEAIDPVEEEKIEEPTPVPATNVVPVVESTLDIKETPEKAPAIDKMPDPPKPMPTTQEVERPQANNQRKLVFALGGVVIILLAVIVGFVLISVIGGRDGRGNDIRIEGVDPTDVIGGGYFIHRVVNGNLSNHPNITIGAAFEGYFSNRSWVHFMDGDGNQIVSFTGDMLLNLDTITIEVMFQFTWDESDFQPVGLMSDGVWQDTLFMLELLDYIMVVGQ